MLRKAPAALLVAALIIAIPGIITLVRGGTHPSRALALTPSAGATEVLDAEERVDFWRGRVVHDSDYLNRIHLAASLLELARQTGDLEHYFEADRVITEALEANPTSTDARVVAAAVQAGTHDFVGAAETADAVLAEQPDSVQALAVAGDSYVEVGRYSEAADRYDRLFAQDQGPGALARLASLAWNRGDAPTAVERAEQALVRANEAGLPAPELAFYALQLSTYRLDTGDVTGAVELAAATVDITPELPASHATLAAALAAAGDLEEAAASYATAIDLAPRLGYHASLGDVLTVIGDEAAAATHYAAAEKIGLDARDDRVNYDRELSRFYSDQGIEPDLAVELARLEFELHRDVGAYDTLAWALHRAGHHAEASEVAQALAGLGTRDPAVLYHLGVIAAAGGDLTTAEGFLSAALDISPTFDPIHAPLAAAALEEVRAG